MARAPSETVRDAFGVAGDLRPLDAGEGRAVRGGDVVLKPCDDPSEWAWLGRWLPEIEQDGFRLALPIRAGDGRWVVDGWCAQEAVAGEHAPRWTDILDVSDAFHAAAAHLPRPPFVDARTHAWSIGDRVAWGQIDPPSPDPLLTRLLAIRRNVDLPSQMIHGDLTENVLFTVGAAPAVIDVTPYWRPAGYASAIIVGDAVLWREAEPDPLFDACRHIQDFVQLFVRAIIFRLVTTLAFGLDDPASYGEVVSLAEEAATR